MKYKLTRGLLIEGTWHEAGETISADGRYAETLVRAGAAVPAAGDIETATAEAPDQAEKAVTPRHGFGKK